MRTWPTIENFVKEVVSDWWLFGLGSGVSWPVANYLGKDPLFIAIIVVLTLWIFKVEARIRDLEKKVFDENGKRKR